MGATYSAARKAAWLLAGAALVPFAATSAMAQSADSSPATGEAATANTSGEIVVTAQKRSESIQHVPISIQALGAATLEQHQVTSFDDYAKQLPSVSFQSFGPGQSQLFFRGITSGGDGLAFGALPTSGVYLDEIPVTTIGALLDIHVYDMARVEALSGPQGTLFGASSLSGTLRMITNKPVLDKVEGSFDVTVDKYGKGDAGATVEGMINLPLAKDVAVRIVGFYDHEGGYINNTYATRTYPNYYDDANGNLQSAPYTANNSAYVKNHYNDVTTYGGRVALDIELENGWKISPQVIAQHMHSNGTFLYDPADGDLTVHDFTPEYDIDQWLQAGLTIEGKVGDWDLLYSGGFMARKILTAADYSYYTVAYSQHNGTTVGGYAGYTRFTDANGNQLNPTQQFSSSQKLTKHTEEVRLNSPGSSALRLTTGLFYQEQTNHNVNNYAVPGAATANFTGYANGVNVYGDDLFLTNAYITDRDFAAYAQGNYDITSHLTLTAGLRGFIYTNTLVGFSGYPFYVPPNSTCTFPLATLDSCNFNNKRSHDSGETHKVNLTWQVDTDHMVYATYSTGFRPGGNNRDQGAGIGTIYKPDKLNNFELGWKTSWFDHLLRWNGAAYYEKWNDLQYAEQAAGAGITNIQNVGGARVYGVESDLQLRPAKGLTITATGAYNDAALTTNFGNPGKGNYAPAGTRLPVQPRFKMSATTRYEFPVGSVDAFVQGSMNTQSNSTSLLGVGDDAVFGNSPGFTTADFSVGGKKGNYTFQLFIQNAFDERGSLSHNAQISPADFENTFPAGSSPAHYSRTYPIKPQYFGLKVGTKF
ncbi:TonB-dependent receptor [Novosphingobium sp. FSW06-99]|uniref:TonB-dependent receptor n=1 Tax=Novosphingobium sp. FSW06-99 TaxID=1739113 RepID=UPI00076DD048|nr:TonB-dependent receptor [Novosphingobium sp. FSW06-99]KUR74473.1 TonB-dependent receptor [Novosphingobium sp. FSW06-99]